MIAKCNVAKNFAKNYPLNIQKILSVLVEQDILAHDILSQVPQVIKLFPCPTQLSTKFILLINVKMPTIVGILTFISMINTTSERLKARNFCSCQYFSFYEQLKFRAQLS